MKHLKRENVQICEKATDWHDAIRTAVLPLERGGYVEPRYKEEIIKNVEELGPYIVLAENIAMPHARAEQGVLKTQFSVTLFREPVWFDSKEMPARLFVTLAAADPDSHQDALVVLSELLDDEVTVAKMLQAPDAESLYRFFEG